MLNSLVKRLKLAFGRRLRHGGRLTVRLHQIVTWSIVKRAQQAPGHVRPSTVVEIARLTLAVAFLCRR